MLEKYYLTYTGVKLPLTLLEELEPDQRDNRNTYFVGIYDDDGRIVEIKKLVYGELEMGHQYFYDESGRLNRAILTDIDGEETTLEIAEDGTAVEV